MASAGLEVDTHHATIILQRNKAAESMYREIKDSAAFSFSVVAPSIFACLLPPKKFSIFHPYPPFLLCFFASNISRFISKRFLVLWEERDFTCLASPVPLFDISVFS